MARTEESDQAVEEVDPKEFTLKKVEAIPEQLSKLIEVSR